MTMHLLKLIWNRKRANALIVLEIFFSFLALFGVVTLGVYYVDNYRRPLGFSYEDVWNVGVDMKLSTDDEWTPEMVQTLRQLFLELQSLDGVRAVAGAMDAPYSFSRRATVFEHGGRDVRTDFNEVTDGFLNVLGLTLLQGRWFEKGDDALNWDPVVVNQKFAREMFGQEGPIGRNIGGRRERPLRVVGVISDFRKGGEYAGPLNYIFYRKRLGDPTHRPPRNLLIKVRPGTTAAFEETLNRRLQGVAREWSFDIQPLVQMRESSLRLQRAPVLAVGIIAGFLLIMVGLGLVGVLWQSVVQRTKEIGLRRAQGATAGDIQRQIAGEVLVMASAGGALGTLLVLQLPLLGLTEFLGAGVYAVSLSASLAVIYILAFLCSLYPSWLAARVRPARALHYE